MLWQTLNFLADLLADSSKHFLLAFGAGFLAFLLTSTTLSVLYYGTKTLLRRVGVGWLIFFCSLLVASSFALLSHWALDYYSVWYTTPLGEALELVR